MCRYRYAFVCAIGALFCGAAWFGSTAAAADPSTLPLIQFTDLIYQGAFRLPANSINGESFAEGGQPMTYNPGRNSLFIGIRSQKVAEIDIPTPVNTNNIAAMPSASYLQAFADPTEGNLWQIATSGAALNGLMVQGDRLYGSGSIYYDADNLQRVSHFSRSTTLSASSFVGMKQVWQDQKSGFVAGFMGTVPAEWQSLLGGPAITGLCCLPIMWRTSMGPAAFAWNPATLPTSNPVAAIPLLYYPQEHTTLGRWDATNPTYGGSTEIGGVAVLAGTRTALYIGRNGTGAFCYGNGTGNASLVGTLAPDGEKYCYDPTSSSKGQHGWPYNYQIWAYDLNELAAVKAGTKQPWDVRPYGVWPFAFPIDEKTVRIGGIGYDPSRQLIYISQMYADQDGYAYRPLIHVLKVGGGAAGSPLPTVDTTPLPPLPVPVSTRVTAVSVAPNKAAPQAPGTTITFTATPTGGVTPHQFKWLVYNGVQWNAATGWSASNTFAWTPSTASTVVAPYHVGVWVKSATNPADTLESSAEMEFAISGSAPGAPPPPLPNSAKATGVALASNLNSPQAPGTTITFAATPVGGTAPHQYRWLIYDAVKWNVIGDWTPSNTFAWTPTSANAGYQVGVWIRSSGNTTDTLEVSTSVPFVISGTAVNAPPPPPAAGAKATAVALASNLASPQAAGTTITFTASPVGGVAPHQYTWLIYDNIKWNVIGSWTASNSFAWTPSSANSGYRVGVWVRSSGNTADALETSNSVPFVIGAAGSVSPPPSEPPPSGGTTGARATSVALSVNKTAPQAPGTTMTFAATPAGGAAPYQYNWLVYDGISWKTAVAWTTSNTFAWTPGIASADFSVGVWVRSAGNTGALETSNSVAFPIAGALTAPPAPSETTPTTPQAGHATVTLSANRPAPQVKGTAISFTATGAGGTAPYSYKWFVFDGSTWLVVRGWSATNSYTWTPTTASPAYKVAVWVRSAGNSADAEEGSVQMPYAITSTAAVQAPPAGSAPLTSVVVGANKIAPQPRGSTTTFTAVATGGTGPLQYKWLVYDGLSWVPVGTWTTTATFNWTPATASTMYRVGVWVRNFDNTVDAPQVSNSIAFLIQ